MRFAYVILTYLLVPVVIGHLLWRSVTSPAYRQRIPERFGFGFSRLRKPSIWVHAVSIGEVQAAAPLVRALQQRYPEKSLVVTSITPTGSERVRALFGDTIVHSYAPLDTASAGRRCFDWARPELVIIIETELWPNLYHECGQRRIPLVLASARVSPQSVRRYRLLIALFSATLSHGIVIAAQSTADAERFRSLGASAERTRVTGNIKFDFELPPRVAERGREFRLAQAPDRLVWIAASTHELRNRSCFRSINRCWRSTRMPCCYLCLVTRSAFRAWRP
jgi:3-deoxy-D-manno-octulosonic-acid transferase